MSKKDSGFFEVGEFLRGEQYRTGNLLEGLLLHEDPDGTLCLLVCKGDDDDPYFDTDYIKAPGSGAYPGAVSRLAVIPDSLAPLMRLTKHVFLVEADGPDGPVIELYASPQAIEVAHPDVEDLRTRIMEAVADPGEKVYLNEEVYLSFRSIQGEIA